ncbi:MAG: PorT family protein [Chitinophagia bacterium]|nr:PorT family protein [Chitinophagia bacterium]
MYRWLCKSMLCALCISSAYAQEQRVFNGYIAAGANFAQVDGDSYYGYHRAGLNAGPGVLVKLSSAWQARLELLYSVKGSRGQTITTSPYIGQYVTKYYMNLRYVEIPVTMGYSYQRYAFEAGIGYARLVGSEEWLLTDQPFTIDPDKHRFNSTDIGMILGGCYQLSHGYGISFRWEYSLVPIRPYSSIPIGYSYGYAGQFNNVVAIRLLKYFGKRAE